MKFNLKEDASPHPRRWWHWPLLAFLVVGTVLIAREFNGERTGLDNSGKWSASETQRDEGAVFGTFYHISYRSQVNLQHSVDSVLSVVDQTLSLFNPHSVLSAINANESVVADSSLLHVLSLAKSVYDATDGAFDVTVGPLTKAWGFGTSDALSLSEFQIDSLREFVGFDKISIKGDSIIKSDPRVLLDLSAIAKGYGVDAVCKYLEQTGVQDYMVEIGGEIRLHGSNPDGDMWHIGILRPSDDRSGGGQDIQEVISLQDCAVATSGNYRNYYDTDQGRVAHTIDPRTGQPVQRDVLSATVIAPDCATADAYATSFMVIGLEEAKEVLKNNKELKAYLICVDSTGVMQTHYINPR